MTVNLDWIIKYLVPIVGAIAALTVLMSFFWGNLRKEAKRLAIVDLASKRLAFWKQFMETANLVTPEGSDERKAEQNRVYQAILRVQEDAQLQTKALVKNNKINRSVTWKAFRFEGKKLRRWYHKLAWVYFILLAAFMLSIALLVFGRVEYRIISHQRPPNSWVALVLFVSVAFTLLTRLLLFCAESLKHETVETPLIEAV